MGEWFSYFNVMMNALQILILGGIIHLVVLSRRRSKVANAAYAALLEQLHATLGIMTEVSERQLAWLERMPPPSDGAPPPPREEAGDGPPG